MNKKVMIVTGGTGGHIYPALALADVMKQQHPDLDILFVGTKKRMEHTVIPNAGYAFKGLALVIPNGNIFHKIIAGCSLVLAYLQMLLFFCFHHYDLIIGFGNYIEVPVLKAALLFKIPYALHEQNSIAGKANIMCAARADAIFTSYPMDKNTFNNDHVYYVGNPRASVAARQKQVVSRFHFTKDYPIVTIVMGSLGSETINQLLLSCIELFKNNSVNYLIVTGSNGYPLFKDMVSRYDNIDIQESVDGILAFASSDLVVSRAGASTCAELLALNKPSLLIPSPYVPLDHQTKNAQAIADCGACVIVKEKDLSAQSLNQQINKLINNKEQLEKMKQAAKTLARENAAYDIVKWCDKVMGYEK